MTYSELRVVEQALLENLLEWAEMKLIEANTAADNVYEEASGAVAYSTVVDYIKDCIKGVQ